MRILITCDVNDEKYDGYTLSVYKQFLDAHDFERYFNFKNEFRKKVFLIARGELRAKLGGILHIEPQEIHFIYNMAGKPFIANKNINIFFNIAHSENLIALVISSIEVGIDIEKKKERNFAGISKKIFGKEICDLEEFYETWTTNEAIAKCNGVSLLKQAKDPYFDIDAYDIDRTTYQEAPVRIATRKYQ